MKAVEAKSSGTIHEVKIEGLAPETNYVYRATSVLEDGTKVVGPLSQFQTAVKDNSAFSFAVIGDTQKNPRMTAKIAKVISDRHPHFIMHVGDVVDNGPDKSQWVHELFGPCADLFSHCAILPTIGNHEKNHAWYYRYFSLPDPEYRYRYRYGNADFFVVDSNKSLKPGSEQYQWLDEQLARSSATWKFVYHHHPAWSSDADDYGITKKGVFRYGDLNARNLVTLYEKHKVDIAFNGHIHAYERTFPIRDGKVSSKNGVIYVTSGGGGGRLEDFAALPSWFKAQLRVDFHCCYVTIRSGRLEFKAFDQNGQLFDQFEIDK
jgi:predicted phosphodiesterase